MRHSKIDHSAGLDDERMRTGNLWTVFVLNPRDLNVSQTRVNTCWISYALCDDTVTKLKLRPFIFHGERLTTLMLGGKNQGIKIGDE